MPVTVAFKINNVSIAAPKKSKWIIPEDKGMNGIGQKQYTAFYSYELNWDGLTQAEFQNIFQLWQGHYGSGTATADLPQFNATSYGFITYTGVLLDQPIVGEYNENYLNDVKLIIRRIRV